MALKSPLMPSPTSMLSSPKSPAFSNRNSNRSSTLSDSLAPPPSPYPAQVEPSPVDSNGTENTDIEEDAQDEEESVATLGQEGQAPPDKGGNEGLGINDKPAKLNTDEAVRKLSSLPDDAPQSVIHVPAGFKDFRNGESEPKSPNNGNRLNAGLESPGTPEAAISPMPKTPASVTSPINTDVARQIDRSTPRAQTRHDVEQDLKRKKRSSMLADIPEANRDDAEVNADEASSQPSRPSTASLVPDDEMDQQRRENVASIDDGASLRAALSECWTLCNTLANLYVTNRKRRSQYSAKQEQSEQAWRSCWRLCQHLYDSRDGEQNASILPTLDLCRDFCQFLFEVRLRGDETSDSVLRVSFELNNHLFNTHDRTLPEAFSERTLDFYITLCHRLIKQSTSLRQDIDALLRACWALAEMLFNLRQSRREGKAPDEDQLSSAVQACWDLCDLFREGWSQQNRPERVTPRPTQTTFPSHISSASNRSMTERSNSSLSDRQYVDAASSQVPETPTTIFDDTASASSPDVESNAPNILVLGPASVGTGSVSGGSMRGGSHLERWSSNASVLSGYSESASSQRTSSTATAGGDETHLDRLRYLLIKAAMNTGWNRSGKTQLPTYAQQMSNTSFGSLPWQLKIFNYFQKLVTHDKSMLNAHEFPARRIAASDMAKSVKWLGRNDQWAWMRDLYRIVFGFGIDEVDRSVAIVV